MKDIDVEKLVREDMLIMSLITRQLMEAVEPLGMTVQMFKDTHESTEITMLVVGTEEALKNLRVKEP